MNYKDISTYNDLRYAKLATRGEIERSAERLKARAASAVTPRSRSLLTSDNAALRAVGWGITAYKVGNSLWDVWRLFKRRR